MSRFKLGYRDPQQPNETFDEFRDRSEHCYRDLVEEDEEDDEDEQEYYPSAREIAEEAWS